jgi:ABC-type amino acid transport substrate-binding protein
MITRLSRHRRFLLLAILLVSVLALAATIFSSDDLITRLLPGRDHTWTDMEARGVWRVGLDPSFPPFEMLDEEGKVIGFDVDLARAMASTWGMDVQVVALGFDSLLDAVVAGKVDSVVSAMPYDPRATRDYAYSSPYFEAGVRLAVREDSPIGGVEDLAGRVVAVEWGSMGDMVGRRLQREDIDLELAPYAGPDEAVAALLDDPSVNALLVDNVTLRQEQGAGAAIKAVGPALESNPYVIVLPLTATSLKEHVEQALATISDTGQMEELEDTWFGAAP